MACTLKILGAAWGTADVTAKVWSMVKKDCLVVEAENSTFGFDPMRGHNKFLVVCYQYADQKPLLAAVKEHDSIRLSKPKSQENETSISSESSATSSHQPAPKGTITILGAAWGIEDVTELAQQFVMAGGTKFMKPATKEVWKGIDGWPGAVKTLVVIYQYSDIPMISIARETETMHFEVSPPLFVLGAAFGLQPVTQQVQELIKNRQLHLTPKLDLPNNTWPGHYYKSFVVVYQYGIEKPQLLISDSSTKVSILYERHEQEEVNKEVNLDHLLILGAAYGLINVTENIQDIVKALQHIKLSTMVNNLTMKCDGWRFHDKTLVVIYQYGRSPPVVSITQEGKNVEITKMLPPTCVGFLDSTNLVDDADVILLSAVNNNYVAYIPNDDKLGATAENSGCEFTIEPDSPGMYYLQEKQSRKFCSVNIDGYLTLKSEEGKTLFKLMLSTTGKVRLATTDNKFVRLTDDNFLKADTTEHLIASTSFQLAVDCAGNSHQPSNTEWRNLSSHEKLWLSFLCEVTRGFFLGLGFKLFLRTASPSVGLLHLIQGNENSMKALHTLRKELRPTTSVTKAVCSAIRFLNIVWKEGLLWKVFKFLQLEEGVIIYTEIFTQVIQVLLLPEAEAALLLGGFTTWALELINTSKKLAVD